MLMMIAMINDVYANEVCIMYNDENDDDDDEKTVDNSIICYHVSRDKSKPYCIILYKNLSILIIIIIIIILIIIIAVFENEK